MYDSTYDFLVDRAHLGWVLTGLLLHKVEACRILVKALDEESR